MTYDSWKTATPPEYERDDSDEPEPYRGTDLLGDLRRALERAEGDTTMSERPDQRAIHGVPAPDATLGDAMAICYAAERVESPRGYDAAFTAEALRVMRAFPAAEEKILAGLLASAFLAGSKAMRGAT